MRNLGRLHGGRIEFRLGDEQDIHNHGEKALHARKAIRIEAGRRKTVSQP